jgi:DNA-binding winged helix-turn-helix (wHTH) protein
MPRSALNYIGGNLGFTGSAGPGCPAGTERTITSHRGKGALMKGVVSAAGELRGPEERAYPMDLLAGRPGTLLTVVPAHDGRSQMVIVGYVVPKGTLPRDVPAGLAPAGIAVSGPAEGPASDRVRYHGLVVDRVQHRVLLNGRDVELMFQEFELFELLTAHPHRVFSREEILARAWGDRQPTVTTRTIDVHVHRLRRKLGPVYGQCLVTVRRVGYMFRPPPEAQRGSSLAEVTVRGAR